MWWDANWSIKIQFISRSDPAVHALQFLDVINMKDPTQKAYFYRSTLKDALPFIPRVSDNEMCGKHLSEFLLVQFYWINLHIWQKLWWQHVWPFLQQEMKQAEVLAAVLQPALAIVQEATSNEYEEFILPTFKYETQFTQIMNVILRLLLCLMLCTTG